MCCVLLEPIYLFVFYERLCNYAPSDINQLIVSIRRKQLRTSKPASISDQCTIIACRLIFTPPAEQMQGPDLKASLASCCYFVSLYIIQPLPFTEKPFTSTGLFFFFTKSCFRQMALEYSIFEMSCVLISCLFFLSTGFRFSFRSQNLLNRQPVSSKRISTNILYFSLSLTIFVVIYYVIRPDIKKNPKASHLHIKIYFYIKII